MFKSVSNKEQSFDSLQKVQTDCNLTSLKNEQIPNEHFMETFYCIFLFNKLIPLELVGGIHDR